MNKYLKIVAILVTASGAVMSHAAELLPDSVHSAITKDTLIMGDSAVVITTACAPICSSIARVYVINKVGNDTTANTPWTLVRSIHAPNSHAVFQEAYFEQGQIQWRDNTPQLLDEDGK